MVFFLVSCGRVIHGPHQDIIIKTNQSNIQVIVDGKDHHYSPEKIRLKRSSNHTLTFMKNGKEIKKIEVKRKLTEAAGFYVLPGGLVAMGIDILSGTQYQLIPREIDLDILLEKTS